MPVIGFAAIQQQNRRGTETLATQDTLGYGIRTAEHRDQMEKGGGQAPVILGGAQPTPPFPPLYLLLNSVLGPPTVTFFLPYATLLQVYLKYLLQLSLRTGHDSK